MAKDNLLPTSIAAELQRLFHRAEADVFLTNLRSRLAVDVTTNQHRRAGRNIAQRIEPRNRLQVIAQAQILVRIKAFENAAELQHAIGSDGHGALHRVGCAHHTANRRWWAEPTYACRARPRRRYRPTPCSAQISP